MTWGNPLKFSNDAFATQVSVNNSGDALVLIFPSRYGFQVARLSFGGKWTTPEVLYGPRLKRTDSQRNADYFRVELMPILGDDGFAMAGWVVGTNDKLKYFVSKETVA